jgi:5-methylcytosine-specific restriction enzyme A
VSYLKGFLLGLALWTGVLLLVAAGLRTDDGRLSLAAIVLASLFALWWRRAWRRRRRPSGLRRVPIPAAVRRRVYARDGYTCVYCGRRGNKLRLTIDHVFPVVLGGTNDVANLVTACRSCNLAKGARLLDGADLRRFAAERHARAGRERRRGCALRLALYGAGVAALIALVLLLTR